MTLEFAKSNPTSSYTDRTEEMDINVGMHKGKLPGGSKGRAEFSSEDSGFIPQLLESSFRIIVSSLWLGYTGRVMTHWTKVQGSAAGRREKVLAKLMDGSGSHRGSHLCSMWNNPGGSQRPRPPSSGTAEGNGPRAALPAFLITRMGIPTSLPTSSPGNQNELQHLRAPSPAVAEAH